MSEALTAGSMALEADIQLVFFHPKFQFRDGAMRSSEDSGGANFARRSPWPMINILRTPQVRAAQKGVPTAVVYRNNEERLNLVGTKTLEDMLFSRDWTGLPSYATESKTMTRQAQEASKIQLNLDDPLLTALSDGSAIVCPFPGAVAAVAAAAKAAGCPAMSESVAMEEQKVEESVAVAEEVVVVEEEVEDEEEEIDYMKLADDVDKWLSGI